MRLTGVMGGSFNPVHSGHLMVASYLSQYGGFDEVWLSVSPSNPLKHIPDMESGSVRLAMLRAALDGNGAGLRPCDVELSMPIPSYTITFLRRLREMYPDRRFRLVVGSDNWLSFDRWRDWQAIISEFGVTVYPRPGYPVNRQSLPEGVEIVEAPEVEISSTMIRRSLALGHDMSWFLPEPVLDYIKKHKLYGVSDS